MPERFRVDSYYDIGKGKTVWEVVDYGDDSQMVRDECDTEEEAKRVAKQLNSWGPQ